MTSREIIKRLVGHDGPPRFGMDFINPGPSDFIGAPILKSVFPYEPRLAGWGRHAELLKKLDGFSGDVRLNEFGDIYGRLRGETGGECVKDCLEDGWDILENYEFPSFDPAHDHTMSAKNFKTSEKFVIGGLPFAIFSRFRDSRRLENALADTLLSPDRVRDLMDMELKILLFAVRKAAEFGMDAVMLADDFGTQHALLMSPAVFRALFKPVYAAVAGETHARGMKFFMHSCGMVYEIIPDLIDAGVDVFQFDQPELYGSDRLAREFGERAVFYSPVDIQKIMPTGDRKLIEEGALYMMDCFRKRGGGLIIKDYPSWGDIHVKDEWAQWVRDMVIANASI